jgi:hypothetical protein
MFLAERTLARNANFHENISSLRMNLYGSTRLALDPPAAADGAGPL